MKNRRVGYQRARGDLVTWARERIIMREDLLAFLVREQVVWCGAEEGG